MVTNLAVLEPVSDGFGIDGFRDIQEALDSEGYGRIAEHIERATEYVSSGRAASAPATLTSL